MLDESMFEDIHEIAENSAYLKAVRRAPPWGWGCGWLCAPT
jgi:hypothetical protein